MTCMPFPYNRGYGLDPSLPLPFGGSASPIPPPPSQYFANLPPAWTVIVDDDMTTSPDYVNGQTGWPVFPPGPSGVAPILNPTQKTAQGWTDDIHGDSPGNTCPGIVDGPYSTPVGWMIYYSTALSGGSSPTWMMNNFGNGAPAKRKRWMYGGAVMRWSPNFVNTPPGNVGTKLFWPASLNDQDGRLYITLNGPNMDIGLNSQGFGHDSELYQNAGPAGLASLASGLGAWYMLEFMFKQSSDNDVQDGAFFCWVNSTLTHNYPTIYSFGGAERTWQAFNLIPTYGGGTTNPPVGMFEYVDHVKIAVSDSAP